MNRRIQVGRVALTVVCAFCLASAQAARQEVTARLDKDQVTVHIDGKLFTGYKFAGSQKYPYFWPVNGPASGKSITTETSQPYPHHHSLFFGCDRVNGGNYWQDVNKRGQIVSQGPKIVEASGERIVFTDKCSSGAGPVPSRSSATPGESSLPRRAKTLGSSTSRSAWSRWLISKFSRPTMRCSRRALCPS